MDQHSRINVGYLTKTKIVCTLGPASFKEPVLEKMVQAGMDAARLNFSHGSHQEKVEVFNILRKLSTKYDEQLSIICDIQGPKIRTGRMEDPEGFYVEVNHQIKVTPKDIKGNRDRIQIHYESILTDLDKDDLIFINDGLVRLRVLEKQPEDLLCVVEAAGQISDHKGFFFFQISQKKKKKKKVVIFHLETFLWMSLLPKMTKIWN